MHLLSTFDLYAAYAENTNHGEPGVGPLAYIALALAGEAGEVANEVKKHYRDDLNDDTLIGLSFHSPHTDRREKILLEMGDVLWYLNRLARSLNSSLSEVASMNVAKLSKRHGHAKPASPYDPYYPDPDSRPNQTDDLEGF